MITKTTDVKYQTRAWYYAPVDQDLVNDVDLTWDKDPKLFMGRFIKKTKTGFEIVPGMNATSDGQEFETLDESIDFNDKGKVCFDRINPKIENASMITKNGITKEYGDRANARGNKYKRNQFVKTRIQLG